MNTEDPHDLNQVFSDFIDGRLVKRAKLQLTWEGRDVTGEFKRTLRHCGYLPMKVKDIDVSPGERVPAFHIADGNAYFGWVFWEKFSEQKLRKLFGSVVKNPRGDWEYQMPQTSTTPVYANRAFKSEMDIDNPSGF